jgi:P27 family predicted phage terminase small subunit
MTRGRRKPDNIRALHGESVPARPVVDDTAPTLPARLAPDAASIWQETVDDLRRLRVLDHGDAGLLAAYVQCRVQFERATVLLSEHGAELDPDETKTYERRLREASDRIAAFSSKLGLNASARASISTSDDKPWTGPGLDPRRLLS